MNYLGAKAEPAIPFLVQCLTNDVPDVRAAAASSLGHIQRRPEVVVPALIQYFPSANASPNRIERFTIVGALAQFGTNARPAAPLIRPLLNDPVYFVRVCATNTLWEITGEDPPEIPWEGLIEIP
jgi:HEAT repeat protein